VSCQPADHGLPNSHAPSISPLHRVARSSVSVILASNQGRLRQNRLLYDPREQTTRPFNLVWSPPPAHCEPLTLQLPRCHTPSQRIRRLHHPSGSACSRCPEASACRQKSVASPCAEPRPPPTLVLARQLRLWVLLRGSQSSCKTVTVRANIS
jgi:hypothetical protein